MEYKANSLTTRNNKVKYMFLSQEGFYNRFTQIYSNFKVTVTAKYKLQEFTQQGLAIDYTIQFQTYTTQIKWNNKALIVQYRQGLKAEVQNIMILMEDFKNIRELIK